MSNHTHLVPYVDDKKANRLNDKAIIIRWHKLCKGTVLTQKYIQKPKGLILTSDIITLVDLQSLIKRN